MLLAERHIISQSNPFWVAIDSNAFLSKNLYNAALYIIRQHFFNTSRLLSFQEVYYQVKSDYPQDYSALPRKVSNQVLKQVYDDWINYFKALKTYKRTPLVLRESLDFRVIKINKLAGTRLIMRKEQYLKKH